MENASKALLIAGGMLIAIIVLSLFAMMYNKMTELKNNEEARAKVEQLENFNAEYESFNKKLMYGADVITLANKIYNNNKNHPNDNTYRIKLVLDGSTIIEGIINDDGSSSDTTGTQLLEDNSDFKTSLFKCDGIKYNAAGRVCEIDILTFSTPGA